VMLVVVNRSIHPFANSTALKVFGKQFPAKVAIHIVQHHEQKEKCKLPRNSAI